MAPSITRHLWVYLILLSVLALAGVGLSYWQSQRAAAANTEQLASEVGRAFFEQLLITRRWVAKQGGVYVPISPEVQPNPYLDDPHREVETTDGQQLTKVNPAYMTRLLSFMNETKDGFRFHMSSLMPINPANSPDDWEREALLRFETGAADRAGLFDEATGPVFRYMGRLTVEAGCLHCHERQGYQLGDVRGGIRVSLPWAPFQATLSANQRQLAILHGAILAVLLILLWSGGFFVMRTAREVDALNRHMKTLNRRLESAALTDTLTGMANRMHFDQILEAHIAQSERYGIALALIMLDLDHFKGVNDTYGHAVGDQVLQEFTRVLTSLIRPSDTLARWGGEEFTIAVPGTTLEASIRLAERLRRAVETHEFPMVGTLTVSLGIAEFQAGDSALTLLERADACLYRAKAGGRNRVATQATG